MVSKKLIIIALTFVAIAYHLYEPLHPGISKSWKLQTMFAVLKAVRSIAKIGSLLTCGSEHLINVAISSKLISRTLDPSTFNGVDVKEHYFNEIRTLIFTPPGYKEKGNGSAYIDYHGGGWVFGNPELFAKTLIEIAKELNILIVSVDYRLAPEFPYPIPFQDCLQTTVAFLQKAQDFGVDPNRIAIGGGSAGGNLAAAVALKLGTDKLYSNLPKITAAVLFFPALQLFDFNLPSYQSNKHDALLPQDTMIGFWLMYIHGNTTYFKEAKANNHVDKATYKALSPRVDWNLLSSTVRENYPKVVGTGDEKAQNAFKPYINDPIISPLLASDEDLRTLPRVFLVSCEFDVLRDEALMFKQRLLSLSVPITHRHYHYYHGVVGATEFGNTEGKESMDHFLGFMKEINMAN